MISFDGGSDPAHSYATLPPRLRPQKLRMQRERDTQQDTLTPAEIRFGKLPEAPYTHSHFLSLFLIHRLYQCHSCIMYIQPKSADLEPKLMWSGIICAPNSLLHLFVKPATHLFFIHQQRLCREMKVEQAFRLSLSFLFFFF